MPTPRQHAANVLKFTRSVSLGLLKDWPEDKYCWQASKFDNHPLWTMAHVAGADVWIAGVIGIPGIAYPEAWQALFGQGSKPSSDAKLYPPLAEVRGVFEGTRAAVLNWLEGASEADLAVPLKDKTGGFALDPIDAMFKLSWHEGWHFGQVATVRKALGLPPTMG